MSWATFIKAHLGVIVGMDFFTVEAMTWLGLVRYHVLFAIDIAARKVEATGWNRWHGTSSTHLTGSYLASGICCSTGIHCTRKHFDASSTKLVSKR